MTSSPGSLALIRTIAGAITASFVTAVIVHAASVLVFFAASGGDSATFPQLNGYFFASSFILFLLLSFVAGFDGFRHWYTAAPFAIVVAVLASLFGTLASILGTGATIDGAAIAFLFATLVGPKLIFIVAAVVTVVTVGRKVWAYVTQSTLDVPQPRDRRVALVRLPPSNLADGHVTHIPRSPIDQEKADEQWDAYVAALIENGWDTIEVPVAAEAPDSVFVEDTVVIFGDTAVISGPGLESRRGETAGVEDTVAELGLRVFRIDLPGTLDGGDVLKVGKTVYVGRSGRTNADGIRQLRGIVVPLGYTVVAVPVSKVLHLKSAVTALPDGTVLGFPPIVDCPEVFDRFLAVPEESGVAVVVLGHDSVLMAASAPKSVELVESLGYRVVVVDISEFEKLEGCVTCLSVRIR